MSGTSGSTGSSSASGQPAAGAAGAAGAEPQRVSVQHVLIGFRGSVPGKNITRTQDEAKTLAYDILNRAKGGADFDQLVRQHTDDSPPGIYGMSNKGVQPAQGERARDGMVAAFGDVGFKLPVGGYGIADHDARTSPFGYHVIKRVK
ncbi:MAG TPA: peptidylprolyl isomerase [Chloroflexota bacterium]|nr:peptidylprolyl isomerase [Chloroflexota bacterium]